MTVTNVTPTGNTNQEQPPEQPIDNMGNPVDDKGNVVEKKDPPPKAEGEETVESLQKALKDTKAELTRLQQQKPKADEEGEEEQKGGTENKNLEIEKKKAEEAGVDFGKYSGEYNKDGKLSDDSYKELAEKGYDRQLVDDYIAGQQARVDKQTKEVSAVVGGEENLSKVLEWAGEHLPQEEIDFYNKSVNEGTAAAKMALQAVYTKYSDANGEAPNLISGGSPGSANSVFKSPFEMQKAMDDPRYWSDPDYQAEVEAKAKRSHKARTV